MRRLLTVFSLTCALACSALAGEVPTVGAPAPPPPEATSSVAPGEIPTDGKPGDIPSVGSSVALSVILTAFGLLG
jgi:hypothetical protein